MTTEPTTGDARTEDLPQRFPGQPGALRNETWLTLQTRQAQRLVQGRSARDGQPAIIGLTRFSALVRQVWTGTRAGDPYADWWLLKIHDALESSRRDVASIQHRVDGRLSSVSGVDVAVACSLEPVRLPLTFSHAYAFRGAYLLAAFDETVRGLLTTRHVGLMSRDDSERLMAGAARAVRRAFTSPTGYRFLGVTRDDVRQATARGRQAAELMGVIPDAIVAGEHGAPYGPRTQGGFAAMNARSRRTTGRGLEGGAENAVCESAEQPRP